MIHKVTVMPNKSSIYLPASLGLRNKKINFVREIELSKNKIVLSLHPDSSCTGLMKLHYDKKNISRQHALIKQKRLVEFMEAVHIPNKWIASIEDNNLVLIPKVIHNGRR